MSQEVVELLNNLEKKLDTQFEKVDKRLDRHEELLTQLITMVADTNKRFDSFEEDAIDLDKRQRLLDTDITLLFKETAMHKREINRLVQSQQ